MTVAKATRRRCDNCGRFLGAGVSGETCDRCTLKQREEVAAAAPRVNVAWPPPLPEEEQMALLPPLDPTPRPMTLYAERGIVIPRPSQLHGGPDPMEAVAMEAPARRGGPSLTPRAAPSRRQAEPMPRRRAPRLRQVRVPRVSPQVAVGLVIGILVGIVVPILLTR